MGREREGRFRTIVCAGVPRLAASAVVLAAGQAHVFRTRRSMMTIHLLTVSGAALVYFGSRATVDLVELAAKQSRTSAER